MFYMYLSFTVITISDKFVHFALHVGSLALNKILKINNLITMCEAFFRFKIENL